MVRALMNARNPPGRWDYSSGINTALHIRQNFAFGGLGAPQFVQKVPPSKCDEAGGAAGGGAGAPTGGGAYITYTGVTCCGCTGGGMYTPRWDS